MGHKRTSLELGEDSDIFQPGCRSFNGDSRCQEFSLNHWDIGIMIVYLKSKYMPVVKYMYVNCWVDLSANKNFFPQGKIT